MKKAFARDLKDSHEQYKAQMEALTKHYGSRAAAEQNYNGCRTHVPAWVRLMILCSLTDISKQEYDEIIYKKHPEFWVAKHLSPYDNAMI